MHAGTSASGRTRAGSTERGRSITTQAYSRRGGYARKTPGGRRPPHRARPDFRGVFWGIVRTTAAEIRLSPAPKPHRPKQARDLAARCGSDWGPPGAPRWSAGRSRRPALRVVDSTPQAPGGGGLLSRTHRSVVVVCASRRTEAGCLAGVAVWTIAEEGE